MRSHLLRHSARSYLRQNSSHRSYAVQAPGAPAIEVFDTKAKRLHKERSAANATLSRQVDYLRDEIATRLCDRILDIQREYPRILDFGANACNIARLLTRPNPDPHSAKPTIDPISKRIEEIVCVESSPTLLYRDQDEAWNKKIKITREVLQSPEYLPHDANSFDMALSNTPFIAAMTGGDSLYELRGSLQLAEQEQLGGIGAHVSPLVDVRDVGNLLSRAGFKLLTVDVDDIVDDYPSIFALMSDLQAMGEANAALRREPGGISKDVLLATEAIYREIYGEKQEDGTMTVPATFRIIFMIGWKEAATNRSRLQEVVAMSTSKTSLGREVEVGRLKKWRYIPDLWAQMLR